MGQWVETSIMQVMSFNSKQTLVSRVLLPPSTSRKLAKTVMLTIPPFSIVLCVCGLKVLGYRLTQQSVQPAKSDHRFKQSFSLLQNKATISR